MRPRRLVSVRANQSRRLSSHVFRIVDLIALVVVTIVMGDHQSPVPLLSTPIRQVLPFVVGALALGWALRSMRLYRFVRSDGVLTHLGRMSAALGTTIMLVFVTEWAVSPGGPSLKTCWEWIGLATFVLAILHVVWWLMVRAWRRAGWLTPNLVIVGATEYAEHVISEAIARRHVNVLGVFDDRLDRVPSAVLGVPVLGDIDALLGHKITPFVDRIVIAVEPASRTTPRLGPPRSPGSRTRRSPTSTAPPTSTARRSPSERRTCSSVCRC